MTTEPQGTHVFLVDGSSHMFRSYFQAANQDPGYNVRQSDGQPTGAVRLFVNKLLQWTRNGAAGVMPSHLVIAFDKGTGRNPRKDILPQYKATREAPPADLKAQVKLVRDAVRAFGLEPVESDGVEADDLIAAYAKAARAEGREVVLISSDKDLMQLVGDGVRFYDSESGTKGKPGYRPERSLDAAGVAAEWEGAPPERIGDVLALVGDKVDNIDGVPGIGVKTAVQLLSQFGDLETLLERVDEIPQPKRRDLVREHSDRLRINRRVVALDDSVAMPVPLAETSYRGPDPVRVVGFLKALELNAQVRRVGTMFGIDVDGVPPDPELVPVSAAPAGAPAKASAEVARRVRSTSFDPTAYVTVDSAARLADWCEGARKVGTVAIQPETGESGLVGFGICLGMGVAGYVPLAHGGGGDSLFGSALAEGQVPLAEATRLLGSLLSDPGVLLVSHDVKATLKALSVHGISPARFDDPMLMSYALDNGRARHTLEGLSERYLGIVPKTLGEVLDSRRKVDIADVLPPSRATPYAGRRAELAFRVWTVLSARIEEDDEAGVYRRIDLPLAPVVARMERAGILVDRRALSASATEMGKTLASLETKLHEVAGERFNPGSPKVAGEIMFGKLGLPGAKKTPSGQWLTKANVLEELAAAGHAFPSLLLDWRQISTLKSTFVDGLTAAADPSTGRVHTVFSLAVTNTGRLSSTDPNLQNIPVRTEEGRKVRRAFVAKPGHSLVSADYSQVEIRLLAHVADVPQLRQAFVDGVDIHAATASEMFGVPLEGMPAEVRRRAKAINFGIIYGISAFGLAANLGIPGREAAEYIKGYFERFPGIRDYMEATKEACRRDGRVETLFGRRCHFPGIGATNPSERAAVERAAINAPIQGTAADIVKRAMVRMPGELDRKGLSATMLLQVHDELLFEVPDAEVEATLPLVRAVMEEAAGPELNLSVPLVVDAKAAGNWEAAH